MARSWSRSACHRSYLGSLQATGSCVRAGVSFRRAAWLPFSDALAARPQLTRNFMSRAPESGEGVDPEWLQVERVLARRAARGGEHAYLVKARQRTGGRRSGGVYSQWHGLTGGQHHFKAVQRSSVDLALLLR